MTNEVRFDRDPITFTEIAEACLGSPNGVKSKKPQNRWPSASRRLRHGSGCEIEENTMVFLTIEASKPDGAMYRVALGCNLYLLASLFTNIGRLL